MIENHENRPVGDDEYLEDDQEPPEHEIGDEVWLISYSDMMTLLFGFFVMMYALSKTTQQRQEEVKKALSKSLAGSYVPQDSELAKELKELAKKTQDSELMGQIEVTEPKDGLEITFRSNILFSSGSASLRPQVQSIMQQLVEIILKSVNNAEIMVAGHTDDWPINTPFFPSNWELSAARAATVVKEFERRGYQSHLLVALGYGSSRPSFPNRTKEGTAIPANQEKNRRVVIKVVAPGVIKQPTPSGGGAVNPINVALPSLPKSPLPKSQGQIPSAGSVTPSAPTVQQGNTSTPSPSTSTTSTGLVQSPQGGTSPAATGGTTGGETTTPSEVR